MRQSFLLDRYHRYVDEALLSRIYRLAEPLTGLHVLHINTTAKGGGVVEILQALLPIMHELGIEHEWKVLQLDEPSNRFMGRLTDLMQGNVPGTVSQQDQDDFLARLKGALPQLGSLEADVYVVHDLQLTPLINLLPPTKASIWVCHMDTADSNPSAEHFIRQYLPAYNLTVFNSPESVFKGLNPQNVQVITLGIDPFHPKNKFISLEKGVKLLSQCGIDTTRPLITQVSRFGRWKNPWQAIDAYRLVKRQIPSVQIALVGALEAADDIKALDVLADLRLYAAGDPDIYLLYDPTMIQQEQVNAFQRYSDLIFQRSTREGFGFTITEAMWKKQPIIGTSATGMRHQIIHGYNGYVADETEACANYALKLLQDRTLWRTLGKHARTFVREHYLVPMMIADYLEAVTRVTALNRQVLT